MLGLSILLLLSAVIIYIRVGNSSSVQAQTITSNSCALYTWWHNKHELNAFTPVADDAVRRSTFYTVQVGTVDVPDAKFDSFVYYVNPQKRT